MSASLALNRKSFAMQRNGFTLIELLVLTAIIVLLAGIMAGRVQNFRRGNEFFKGIQQIESAANKAKNEAISTGQTYELTFDSTTQSLKVAPSETNDDSILGSNNSPATGDSSQASSQSNLGNDWTVYQVRNADGTTTSDLSIKFYSDGTAESKTVEFHSGDAPVTLKVSINGTIDVKRGAMPDTDQQDEWEAGNIEQRATQQ